MRKIVDAAKVISLHYPPMKTGRKTFRIAVALNRSLKAVRDEIAGIMTYASKKDDWEIRIVDRNMNSREFGQFTVAWRANGIITDDRAQSRLALDVNGKVPVVFIDSPRMEGPGVTIDNAAVANAAAEFLLRRQYAGYAFVGTEDRFAALHSEEREAAFVDRIATEGIHCYTFRLAPVDDADLSSESPRLVKWLRELPKPCGMLVCSDAYARTVYEACHRARAKIPTQIAVLGIDNETEVDEALTPPLSSILPDFTGAGISAAAMLDRLLSKPPPHRRSLLENYGVKCFFERSSTADASGTVRLASAALAFIRANALSGITVEAVSKKLNTGRRLLEMRFKEAVGHSLRDELLALRLAEVRRLLVASRMSIDAIAAACGWHSATALQALFKRRFGRTMREERQRAHPRVTERTEPASGVTSPEQGAKSLKASMPFATRSP